MIRMTKELQSKIDQHQRRFWAKVKKEKCRKNNAESYLALGEKFGVHPHYIH